MFNTKTNALTTSRFSPLYSREVVTTTEVGKKVAVLRFVKDVTVLSFVGICVYLHMSSYTPLTLMLAV